MKKIIITILVLVAGYIAWYLISPLFITIEVDEALPENIITHSQSDPVEISDLTKSDSTTDEPALVEEESDDLVGFEAPEEIVEEEDIVPSGSSVVGTPGHAASGVVQVLETTGGSVIRYEDFETINGPQLHVYLANDLDAKDFVDLGAIKGTKGNINYEVPENIDLDDYKYVMYWCVPFGVLFNYAEIN